MDAGIVYEAIEGAGLLHYFTEGGFHTQFIGYIACDVEESACHGLCGLYFGSFAFARQAGHGEAAMGELERDRSANAAAGAGDCNDFRGFAHAQSTEMAGNQRSLNCALRFAMKASMP